MSKKEKSEKKAGFRLVVATALALLLCQCSDDGKTSAEGDFVRNVVDTNPPVTPLSPEESIRKIQLPPGYRVELVASEPMVQEPVALAWDGNGRMYVAEMNTYMRNAAPVSLSPPAGSSGWKIPMATARWIK
jgi:hypothetical protein